MYNPSMYRFDFQPKSDFLKRTMPHFKENPELCLVQTRWSFVNKEENLLTRLQNITCHIITDCNTLESARGLILELCPDQDASPWRIQKVEQNAMEFNISKTEIQKALDSHTNELTVVSGNGPECRWFPEAEVLTI